MKILKQEIVPVGKRLLIEPFKQATKTTGGLAIVEGDGNATPVVGTVIRTGDNCAYKVGNVLLFRRYSIDSLKVYAEDGEQEIYLLEESEVIAFLESGEVAPPGRKGDYSQISMKQNADEKTAGLKEASPSKEARKEK